MRIGTALLLVAVGAILRFAVTVSTPGFNLHTIGVILMVIGAIGFLLSLLWMIAWADRENRYGRRDTYVEREYPARTVREP